MIGGDWTEELLVVPDPDATLHEWCERMAIGAAVPAEPIWQWAYIERVSTGLFMTKLGESHGAKMLDVAYRLFAA